MLKRKLGIIDLTKEKIRIEEVQNSLRKKFLGGRGMNVYYLNKFLPQDIDPLSPENILIIGAGFLTGTLAPSSSRFNVTAKSPETGFLGDTNCGGFFASELRYAGFDRLIIKGKAREPSYIYVNDLSIEVKSARDYWGMDTIEAQKAIRKELGQAEMIVIGVAGEKLVRFANIRTGIKNSGGRCGLGCVMGSKNIKGIVASGTIGIEIVHTEKMLEAVEKLKEYILSSKITPILGSVGTPLLYEVSNAIGAIRTKNSQLNAWTEKHNASEVEKYVEKMIACSSCFVHCRHRNKLGGEGPEYTALVLVGANIGMEKLEDIIELNNICNDYGLDVSSAGTILAWVFELYERKIIDEKITEEPLRFGDFELTKRLLYKISRREGFGNILAESTRAVSYFGEKSKDYLIAIKGLPQSDPHDVRYMKAFALGIATASRGADHLRSRPTLEIFFKLPHEVKERIYGKGISPDPTSYEGKEKTVYFSDNIFATIDCLGICKFICHGFNSPHFLDYKRFRELIYLASDWDMSESEIEDVGKRVIDIERLFNIKQGLRREHDSLPKRYFDEPSVLKAARGHSIDRQKFADVLTKYYALRNWDENGFLSKERIAELEEME
ncbi:MAG: aldehyde ferredoxin oxidoreductase family protein [Candidatus Thermoplasmatota archaeon]